MNKSSNIEATILLDILAERKRQKELKIAGQFTYTVADDEMSDFERLSVIVEEVGEVSTCLLEESGRCAVKEKKHDKKAEIIQVAACCWAWLENIYNNEEK